MASSLLVMAPEDVLEALLRPCAPSQSQQRDETLVNAGERASTLAEARSAIEAVSVQSDPEAPTTGLRARLMASVSRPGRFGVYADRVARMFRIPVVEAEKALAWLDDPARFRPSGIPGVDVLPVDAPAFATGLAVLARIAPGVAFPRHAHRGDETMLILAGGLREETGVEAWRGDELYRQDGTAHAFVALDGEPCIAASLVEGTIELL